MYRRGTAGRNFREGLFLDGGDNHVESLGSGGVQHQQGEGSVARDEADAFRHGQHALPERCLLMICIA